MTTRLYYAHLRSGGFPNPELTMEPLPPDGLDFYNDGPVKGIRLTAQPDAWDKFWLLIGVDVPLDIQGLLPFRVQWDQVHESYDLPTDLVNSCRRVWIRDEHTAVNVMLADGPHEPPSR